MIEMSIIACCYVIFIVALLSIAKIVFYYCSVIDRKIKRLLSKITRLESLEQHYIAEISRYRFNLYADEMKDI